MHLHDYVKCDCGAVGVDGGNITPRYIGDIGNIRRLTVKNIIDYANKHLQDNPVLLNIY